MLLLHHTPHFTNISLLSSILSLPSNVLTSLSPVLFCTYVTIPRIALLLRRYVSCLTIVTSHLMLCFSSVPLFRSALSLRRYACVSHCTIVCLHITLCTICMSLYLVPRFDVLAALLYSTSLNHVLYWSCVIISGTELLLGRHIWLYSSHVVKYRIVQFLRPVTSYSIAVMSVGRVVLFSPLHIPYSTHS